MSMKTMLIVCGVLLACINIWYYKKTRKPFTNGFLGVLSGVAALIPASLILKGLGIQLAVNYVTLSAAALTGVPGVILMGVLMKL